jgi:manganese transport protein
MWPRCWAALAIQLLLGLPLWAGIVLTAGDTLIVLGLEGRGFRRMEAIVAALVGTIALCFLIELLIVPPDGAALVAGLAPDLKRLAQPGALALAVGIVGATVMPHNLYLHSSIVQCAAPAPGETGKAPGDPRCQHGVGHRAAAGDGDQWSDPDAGSRPST